MDLNKILSISGKHGLFQVVSQLKNAVLVESLTDKKRFPAFAHEKISSLKEISVFTTGEDKPLRDVLKAMYDKFEGKPTIDPRTDDKVLRTFFLDLVPDYDQERVYISDIKKMIGWYNQLAENNILDFSEPEEKAEETSPKTELHEAESPADPARKKKAALKVDVKDHPASMVTPRKTRKKV